MAQRRRLSSSRAFDRFIPYRPQLDVDLSHARLRSVSTESMDDSPSQYRNTRSENYRKLLSSTFEYQAGRVLPISSGTPKQTSPFSSNQRFFPKSPDEGYSSPTTTSSPVHRRIPSSPECIMDMPGLRDDFYTNLLDWGPHNLIAVALFQSTYVWNADSRECQRIEIKFSEDRRENERCFLTALCWCPRNKVLAIADSVGEITVCDVETQKSVRKFATPAGQTQSIGSILWTHDYGIISGTQKGAIILHDHRASDSGSVLRLMGHHKREVCGLKREPGTHNLASGGDDGLVNIWDMRMTKRYRTITAHSACTKALAWCPWRRGVLASGGGTSDGHIRVWNIHSDEKLAETYTKSQICGLVWSNEYKELMSAHGTPDADTNDLVVWNMKSLKFDPVQTLHQHSARPLHLAISPDQTTVASAGADEALCLWKVFPRKSGSHTSNKWFLSPLNSTRYIK